MGTGGRDQLLERSREVARLRAALDAARRRGTGRLVVIRSRIGLGKSRLLNAAYGMVGAPAVSTFAAAASELESDLPFGVVLQLFEALARNGDPALFAGAAGLAAAALRGERAVDGDDGNGLALQHGLFWLTSNLSERRPIVIGIDDAHWCDQASLRYVAYLARRLEELPVVLVLTDRTGERVEHRALLDELATLPVAETLELAPLSDDAMATLVRTRMPDADEEFCSACVEIAGGNPLFLREMLLELERQSVGPVAAAAARIGQLAPESISRMALRRIGRLPGAASDVARAVAVLGDDANIRLVAHVAGLDEPAAGVALDALATAEILSPSDPVRFDHPLLRTAVYEDIPARARAAGHVRAAAALRDEGAAAERVATHLLHADPGAGDWAVHALREAAAAARARAAPDSALPYLKRTLAEQAPPDVRAATLVELGEVEAALGIEGASAHFAAAAELVEGGEARARVMFVFGRRLSMTGRFGEAATTLERALAELGERDSPLRTPLEAGYVTAARLSVETRPRAIERMNGLVDRLRDEGASSDVERILLGNLAFEKAVTGEPHDEVVSLARAALSAGTPAGITADGTGFYSAATALAWADGLEEADAALARALDEAQRAGSVLLFARASAWRAWTLYRLGRVSEAAASAESALEHRGYGLDVAGPATNAALALALLDRGEVDGARRALAIEDRGRWAQSAPYAYYLDACGWLALTEGRSDDAWADFQECGRLMEGLHVRNPALVTWRWGGALAAARSGERESAVALAEQGLELARAFGAARPLGLLLMARGLVEPNSDGGLSYLEQAAATLERSQARLDHARAQLALGSALRRAGRRSDAREPLRAALDGAHRCGAHAVAERARAELVSAGGRPRRRALSGVEALTPGERRVAEMVASGMTNREIAQALFITMKGVQWHLRHVYRKLEVATRDQIASRLEPRD